MNRSHSNLQNRSITARIPTKILDSDLVPPATREDFSFFPVKPIKHIKNSFNKKPTVKHCCTSLYLKCFKEIPEIARSKTKHRKKFFFNKFNQRFIIFNA
jgi:hypothetical protein